MALEKAGYGIEDVVFSCALLFGFVQDTSLTEFSTFVDKSQRLNREIQQKIRTENRAKLSKKEQLHKVTE